MVEKCYAIILAAGRGPEDPMAKAFGVSHKCTVPVAGVPMLKRVVATLRNSKTIHGISISIENQGIVESALQETSSELEVIQSENSAPFSAYKAIAGRGIYPVLITTADHALLTPEMVEYFCEAASSNGADFSAGLARQQVIEASYPQSIRTYFKLGEDRVSGCNLFFVRNAKGLVILDRWRYLENVRKKPWRLVAAFGVTALLRFALGRLSLEQACQTISVRLGLIVRPVLMPFAEAAIDVDKQSDLILAEQILSHRLPRR